MATFIKVDKKTTAVLLIGFGLVATAIAAPDALTTAAGDIAAFVESLMEGI